MNLVTVPPVLILQVEQFVHFRQCLVLRHHCYQKSKSAVFKGVQQLLKERQRCPEALGRGCSLNCSRIESGGELRAFCDDRHVWVSSMQANLCMAKGFKATVGDVEGGKSGFHIPTNTSPALRCELVGCLCG